MFGTNKNPEEIKKQNSTPGSTKSINSLVEGSTVDGTIQAENDIRIDGKLNGSLHCKGKVIIGPTGNVEGDINCQNAVVEGSFKGILNASELLNIRESAVIQGEINTQKLLVQSGAIFNVTCKMGGQVIKGFDNKKGPSKEEALTLS